MDAGLHFPAADLCQTVAQSRAVSIEPDQMQIKVTRTFSWQLILTEKPQKESNGVCKQYIQLCTGKYLLHPAPVHVCPCLMTSQR